MADKAVPTVKLNDHLANNWKSDAGPVAMLNASSTTHEQVAYCWGLAANLNVIANLGVDSEIADVSSYASLVSSMLVPLLATLNHLGGATYKAENGAAHESDTAPN